MKGWMVAEAHIYVDDGINGAEFAKRPGLVRQAGRKSTLTRRTE
jgi:hypothetical protein